MDFSYTEEQVQIKDLASQILSDNSTDSFLMDFDRGQDLYCAKLWGLLGDAGLLGMAVPEELGGSGFGITEICQILEEQGRHVAPVPLLPSLVLGGLPIAKYGNANQKQKYLPNLASGKAILTAAIAEESMVESMRSVCTATGNADTWSLNGERVAVPYAQQSSVILVCAETTKGKSIFLVEPTASGLELDYADSTSHEPLYNLTFTNTPAEILGSVEQGGNILQCMLDHANVAAVAVTIGIVEEALRRTAQYTSERKQFETSIASFQNTTMKLADCYIDIECIRSNYMLAMWQLSEGLNAEAAVHTAKWWAAIGGNRITHTCQHLHGGIGADIEYPLHRYYLWAKQMEMSMGGGGSKQLADLGALIARDSHINILPEIVR